MGTRADFYVGRGESAEWLGSIAWDGHPGGVFEDELILSGLRDGLDEASWRTWVAEFLHNRDDATLPEQGWPWPWEDSRTTDYAHAFDGDAIWSSCFGHEWFRVDPDKDGYGELDDAPQNAVFPDMTGRQNVTYGPRSGVLVVSLRAED
jgi:hypothetical protein